MSSTVNRRHDRAFEAEISREERRLAWERERCPKAHALLDRCSKLLQIKLDESTRQGIEGLRIPLAAVARSGRDIDDVCWDGFEVEVAEMLERAEASE